MRNLFRRALKNNSGAAMILAMIVLIVMVLLGTALWQYSTTDTLHTSIDEKRMQAHYIARSAAESVAEYIIKEPSKVSDLIAKQPGTGIIGNGSFKVSITDVGSQKLDIQAVGTVNGVEQKVTLRIARTSTPVGGTFKHAIFAMNSININGNAYVVNGDIGSNGNINAMNLNTNVHGVVTPNINPPINYKRFSIPDTESFPDTIVNIDTNRDVTVSNNMQYGSINMKGRSTLIFDARTKDLYIKVGSYLGGNIKIIGTHIVYMYVDSFRLEGNDQINPDTERSAGQFILVANDENSVITLATGGNPLFKGVIYAPNSTVNYNGNPEVTGAIIAGNFTGSGSIEITHSNDLDDSLIPVTGTTESSFAKEQWR